MGEFASPLFSSWSAHYNRRLEADEADWETLQLLHSRTAFLESNAPQSLVVLYVLMPSVYGTVVRREWKGGDSRLSVEHILSTAAIHRYKHKNMYRHRHRHIQKDRLIPGRFRPGP
ncbi:unnamed protein product [Protopolystoma xenopodis]|uniref:Uncharacterized protein n=1 Tax=Protopolystoma xenopodis TaxID=117903 RepID=A0A3S5FCT2_9PLAT|nr:unnamed protein product [Protopolystoma xenopodis]